MTRKSKRERAKERTEQTLQQLRQGVEDVIESDTWQRWLDVQARFHSYSWGNTLLIFMQNPNATQVAGFRKWQELGRSVVKGERGMKIIVPRSGPCWDCDGEGRTGDGGDSYACGKCGGSGRFTWFTTGTVFDIEQTEGEPLPSPAQRLEGDADQALRTALRDVAEADGYTVELRDTASESLNGWCDYDTRTIVVGAQLEPAQQVKTLAHELAHAQLHEGTDKTRNRVEVEAESVAYVVCQAHGLDTADYTFGYVAGWSGGKPEVVEEVAELVSKTARSVIDRLDLGAADEAVPAAA